MFFSSIFLRAPYVPTPSKVVRKMIKFADLEGTETIYDLGAGDARLLIESKNLFPKIVAKGFELSPLVFLLGKLRIWKSGHAITFRMQNIFRQNVSDADCIFLYLMPGAMKTLEDMFADQLQPGTKIISHAFRFPGRKHEKSMTVPWLSGEKEVYLYIW